MSEPVSLEHMRRFARAIVFAVLLSTGAAQEEAIPVGDWTVLRSVDPFTDATTSVMYVTPIQYPQFGDEDLLAFACTDDVPSFDGVRIMVIGSTYISETNSQVTYRVDSLSPVTQNWLSTDKAVYAQPMYGRAFLAAMLTGTQVAFRYKAYDSSPTYIFSINGLREALEELGCYSGTL